MAKVKKRRIRLLGRVNDLASEDEVFVAYFEGKSFAEILVSDELKALPGHQKRYVLSELFNFERHKRQDALMERMVACFDRYFEKVLKEEV